VQRKALGEALERRVGHELAARGWTVNRYGQGALSENIRAAMRSGASALRWSPDLIAARGDRVVTADCKAQQPGRSTGRHAIECAAVKAHIRFIAMFETPVFYVFYVFYVFDVFGVLSPHDVLGDGRLGPRSANGSGTPCYLIEKDLDRDFDRVFGPRLRAEAELAA
jgi:Holliday junction resolvase